MTDFWKPDLAFWSQLPKAMLLDALTGAPALTALAGRERDALLKAHAKLKKNKLAHAVEQAFDGTGCLPARLISAPQETRYELTEAGLAALEAAA